MSNINLILSKAVQALNRQNFTEVELCCNQVLQAYPNQLGALHILAVCKKQQLLFEESRSIFEKCLSLNANHPIILSNFANLLVLLLDFQRANELFERSTQLDKNHVDAWFNWSALLIKRGNYLKAEEKVNRAIALNPNNPMYFNLLASALRHQEKYVDALKTLEHALTFEPENFYLLHSKGVTLRELKQPNASLECYQLIIDKGATHPEFLYNLASTYMDIGNNEEAEKYLNQVINIQPEYMEAHETLNNMYWETAQDDKFLKSFKRSLVKVPQSETLWFALAANQIMAKNELEARNTLNSAIQKVGKTPRLSHALGVLYAKTNDLDKAMEYFTFSKNLQPDNIRYLIDCANIYLRQKEPSNAQKHLSSALRIAPLNQELWAYQGICWRLAEDDREHWLNNYDAFVQAERITTPPGYDNFEHFITTLKSELFSLHSTTRQPLDQSVQGGIQTSGHLLKNSSKVIQDYATVLSKRIAAYLNQLPTDETHPFLRRKRSSFSVSGCWSVLLQQGGFHSNHVHPDGWLSGPTYINVPKSISNSDPNKSGWVKFGESSLGLGVNERIGKEICPEEGLSVLFPSYIWHGTYEFAADDKRMTIPCDIDPAK